MFVKENPDRKKKKVYYDYDYSYDLHLFLSYVISDQQLLITFRKFTPPLEKSTPPFLLTPPLPPQKIKILQVPPFLLKLRIF